MGTDTKRRESGGLWDSQELSVFLNGIPVATLDQWAYRGVGPRYVKVGRHRRYRESDVMAWLDRQARGGDAA